MLEAIESGDTQAVKDELGDVLFQVVFHAQMGKEAGLFDLNDVAAHVADKMIERHPHVFGTRDTKTAGDVLRNWETDKEEKRRTRAAAENRRPSILDGVQPPCPPQPAP